ncbi:MULTISPECIES: type VI secretion system protein TssA [Pseudomonas]|uniref:type VI secretion system protein TssA n=1 Tax=Pseudomonas nitroreducens TaxID=46680 RepID=UPI001E295923|nr:MULTISPECIES: type VI secretion system protein TssA [Pseudomonas]MCE4072317.1 type VI secretion system protein TssA [Pseudomonas nitritireducens]MCE4081817.1 type VI secretion system protein TssA [Pseudomonas nitroreducens]
MISDETLQAFLQPLPGDSPCGESLRHDPRMDRLRELRREEDTELPAGVWQAEPKRADWLALAALAEELLARRSKDLTIAGYLGEAWIVTDGPAGLAAALGLLADLCDAFPEQLHPQATDGDQEWRAAPLAWLARRYTELLLTRVPLCSGWPQTTLHGWQELQRRQVQVSDNKVDKVAAESARQEQKRLNESIRSGTVKGWAATLAQLGSAAGHLRRLDAWCDLQLGDAAPSLHQLAASIDAFSNVIQGCMAMAPQDFVSSAASEASSEPESVPVPASRSLPAGGAPQSREEAYRQLTTIAEYLARTEPHSPVPYIIRRAVEWGGMPLSALMDELVHADPEARRVWVMLGVLR